MITFEDVKKHYRKSGIVLQVNKLDISKSQFYGLLGNNGAGKTTLLKAILDLIPLDSGRVLIEGKSVNKYEDWKRRVGAYLDESFLIPFLTPLEYFEFIAVSNKISPQLMDSRLEKLILPRHI